VRNRAARTSFSLPPTGFIAPRRAACCSASSEARWLRGREIKVGAVPTQFFTVSTASIQLANNLNLRLNEYGSILPQAIAPGSPRQVTLTLELYGQNDSATTALYQAARQQTPISMMFQMGQTNGQLVGVYLQGVVPEVPEFDDSDTRLKWKFSNTRAQGTGDNEMVVAFG
jgi:hypothetical protein